MPTHKYQAQATDLQAMDAHGAHLQEPPLEHVERGANPEDYELIKTAVLETARGRWFLAEHARRERADERLHLMSSIRRLERVAQENLEALRFSAIAEDVGRKLDNVLRSLSLPQDGALSSEERRRIEQRLIEPRPFIQK
jgi:hypothetical protein